MAKLFEVEYVQDMDSYSYLTIGNDSDTKEDIELREYNKTLKNIDCLYFYAAKEVTEVDGHKIVVE